ncbi:TPA: aminoglycoside phosphotransferase family protein [Candidatus Bathyarchaeota archaeon]|nr:aminoglycoside phosphotransferase family protein [Candidatus Bathyarchaeota archaeon]
MIIRAERVQRYLEEALGKGARLTRMSRLGAEVEEGAEEIKGYGYGEPLLLEVEVDGEARRLVLTTVRPGPFGHEFPSDRARMLLWAHSAYNRLPRHVRSVDVGAFRRDGSLVTLGDAEEFFLVTEYVEGEEYWRDLERIRRTGELRPLDVGRAGALAGYIADVHAVKRDDPGLYVRRIRELLGHGEQLMGLLDSYDPSAEFLEPGELVWIEKKCVEWRWRLKKKTHRLCRVHGDFHPFGNIIFAGDLDFVVLDRSRGEWGEAADDVSAMSINYLFFSIRRYGRLHGPFERLWNTFIDRYLELTGDEEVMEVIAPFLVWRSTVVASPIWYPTLDVGVRRAIFNLIHGVLESEVFDYKGVNSYLGRA